jgi:hypothetical protein
MSQQDLCHSIKLKSNIILPEELERKINSVTEHQRAYIRSIFLRMIQVNPTNAAILYDFLVAQQNELNIKESTKESTIKRIIWLSANLNHKTFNEITKDDIQNYPARRSIIGCSSCVAGAKTNDVLASPLANDSILIVYKEPDGKIFYTSSGSLQFPKWTSPTSITFDGASSPTVIPSVI